MDNANIELIRGHMDTIILRTLLSSDKYGLEILNEIKESSQELYALKQPTLYNSLKRLEKQGYIISYPGKSSNGAQRIYYKLSNDGREFVTEDQRQWEFSRTIIDKLISDKVFDPALSDKPFETSELRPSTKRVSKDIKPDNDNLSEAEQIADIIQDDIDNNIALADTDSDNNNAKTEQYTNKIQDNVDNNIKTADTNPLFSYNNDALFKREQPLAPPPIRVAAATTSTIDSDDKLLHFTDEIKPDVAKNVVNNAYKDIPSALETLYDPKWEKKPIMDYGYNTAPKPPAPTPKPIEPTDNLRDYSLGKAPISKVTTSELNHNNSTKTTPDSDKETAAAILYSKGDIKKTNSDNLTHYNVDYKPTKQSESASPQTYNGIVEESDAVMVMKEKVAPAPKSNMPKSEQASKFISSLSSENGNNSVNYISSLDNIFKPKADTTKSNPSENKSVETYERQTPTSKKPNEKDEYYEEMNFAKLKAKLTLEDINLKQYVKSNTSTYYVNNYFYSSKLLRDWSLMFYAVYAIFCIIAFFVAKTAIPCHLGVFLGAFFIGAILPIATSINCVLKPNNKRPTNYNLSYTAITGGIFMLIGLIAILLISFLIVKINIADIKTMIEPLIIPLVSLFTLIPTGILIYTLLYNSKKYHLR